MAKAVNQLNQPVTLRKVCALAGIVVGLALVFFGAKAIVHWWNARPKSVAQQQSAIRNYLKQQSHKSDFTSPFDFDLRRSTAAAQTNALRLKGEVALLNSNIVIRQEAARALNREASALTEKERVAKRNLAGVMEQFTDRTKRFENRRGELSLLKSNAMVLLTNATSARNVTSLASLQEKIRVSESNVTVMQSNVTALTAQKREAEQEFAAREKEASERRAALTAAQAEMKEANAKLNSREKDSAAARREANAKEQALSSQAGDFSRTVRNAVKQAVSYEAIYVEIGKLLWTADRLLASGDPAEQRQGAVLSEDAAQYAVQNAENFWLAARICEAYLWPNLERFDLPGKPPVSIDPVLQTCGDAFNRAGEKNNVLKNYRLMLQYARTPRAADRVRLNLANELEQNGQRADALALYREIQDSNYTMSAERRIANIERQAAQR